MPGGRPGRGGEALWAKGVAISSCAGGTGISKGNRAGCSGDAVDGNGTNFVLPRAKGAEVRHADASPQVERRPASLERLNARNAPARSVA